MKTTDLLNEEKFIRGLIHPSRVIIIIMIHAPITDIYWPTDYAKNY